MTLDQAQGLTLDVETAISAAVEVGVSVARAIRESAVLADADKNALIGRIKAAQAAVPEWD